MNSYDLFMAPLEKMILANIRKKLMKNAYGNVLEIGFGSGANMKYYKFDQIKSFSALDINDNMRYFDNVEYHVFDADTLPFLDNSFDCVVLTLALCSIKEVDKALLEIKRVLKDDGIYIFIEHERPENNFLYSLFKILNPLWRKFSGGCQIILDTHNKIVNYFNVDYNKSSLFYYGIAKKCNNYFFYENKCKLNVLL